VPEIPDEAVRAALIRYAELLCDRPEPTVLSDERLIRLTLEAAAPVLAEYVAAKITAHADRQFPKTDPAKIPGRPDLWRTWHRHFGIAARIAAGAFYTDADIKRMAADAIARGDAIVCAGPEAGGA
jgi:hypothetical protein